MVWKFIIIAALLGSPAAAQMSGCVRDSNGVLQCKSQRTPAGADRMRTLRGVTRPDLAADALRRSDAIVAARRQALEQQRIETDRNVGRSECRGRAAGDIRQVAGCGL